MSARRSASVICLAGLALLLCLVAIPAAGVDKPEHAPYGPVDGDGTWLEDPGGGVGGDGGGDPDELVLAEPPDHARRIISEDGTNLSGQVVTISDFLRLRIWWLSFLIWSGAIR